MPLLTIITFLSVTKTVILYIVYNEVKEHASISGKKETILHDLLPEIRCAELENDAGMMLQPAFFLFSIGYDCSYS